MDSAFTDWLRRAMADRGLSSKGVTLDFVDAVADRERLEFDTVASRLSKLLGGKLEGRRFFFAEDKPWRREALARAIGTTGDDLARRLAASDSTVTLLLDPRLPEEALRYFHEKEAAARGRYRVVDVPAQDRVREALRDAALEASAGGPVLVVLESSKDADFLEGAAVECTSAWELPRGWQLRGHRDLVPLEPPRLFDDDGNPLVPLPDEDGGDPGEEGVLLSQALPELLETRVETSLQHTGRGGVCCLVEPTINLGVLTGADDRTQVWADGKRVFALGPRTAEVREKLARWHRVQEAEWPAEWKRLTREGANPWLLLETVEDDGSELVARLRPMLGQAIDPFRHALAEWARQRMSTMAEVVKKPPRGRAVRPDAAAERAARAEIARLVDRGSADDERSVRFHFTLERLQRCPLRVVPAAEGERLHAWADLGAGHVVELLVRGLDGPPVPPRWQASGTYGDDLDDRAATEWYEAGDCCCFLWSWEARNLEGVALPARDRRRREADAADDDD